MKSIKRLAWVLPTVALVFGAVALASGFTGATGADLPTPVDAEAGTAQATGAGAVDGESWKAMMVKGSARGF